MEVTLNRNGWHRKLQRFVFGNPPVFNSLCPYFWLTVFCFIVTFIIPVMPFVKGAKWLLAKFFIGFERLFNWFDRAICQPIYEEACKNMSAADVADSWLVRTVYGEGYSSADETDRVLLDRYYEIDRKEGYSKIKQRIEKFSKWKTLNPDWEKKLEEYRVKRKTQLLELKKQNDEKQVRLIAEREAKEIKDKQREEKRLAKLEANKERIAAAAKRRQAMFINIVKYTKWLAYALVSLIFAGVLYLLYQFIYFVGTATNWIAVLGVLKTVGLVLIGLAILAGIIYLIVKLVQKCSLNIDDFPKLKKFGNAIAFPFIQLAKGVVWLGTPLSNFFKAIGSGFVFVWQYAKATKDNYCPAINWIDEEDKK